MKVKAMSGEQANNKSTSVTSPPPPPSMEGFEKFKKQPQPSYSFTGTHNSFPTNTKRFSKNNNTNDNKFQEELMKKLKERRQPDSEDDEEMESNDVETETSASTIILHRESTTGRSQSAKFTINTHDSTQVPQCKQSAPIVENTDLNKSLPIIENINSNTKIIAVASVLLAISITVAAFSFIYIYPVIMVTGSVIATASLMPLFAVTFVSSVVTSSISLVYIAKSVISAFGKNDNAPKTEDQNNSKDVSREKKNQLSSQNVHAASTNVTSAPPLPPMPPAASKVGTVSMVSKQSSSTGKNASNNPDMLKEMIGFKFKKKSWEHMIIEKIDSAQSDLVRALNKQVGACQGNSSDDFGNELSDHENESDWEEQKTPTIKNNSREVENRTPDSGCCSDDNKRESRVFNKKNNGKPKIPPKPTGLKNLSIEHQSVPRSQNTKVCKKPASRVSEVCNMFGGVAYKSEKRQVLHC
ncbi:hypothetical protein [Wolbachia endosymbiont of Pentidionis agamae]|uniref:hypothetical protein n=1 Tax=Wolbachia endosymbiont of Pentidionis agamae TaxID=3110435 RepID=UPI002FCEA927